MAPMGPDSPRSSKGEPFRRARSRGRAFVATVKKGKMAYLDRRIERVGVAHLEAMSDRDIGLTRSQIESAVRGERRSSAQVNLARSSTSRPATGRGDLRCATRIGIGHLGNRV